MMEDGIQVLSQVREYCSLLCLFLDLIDLTLNSVFNYYFQFSIAVWLGLGRKTTCLVLEKDHVFLMLFAPGV